MQRVCCVGIEFFEGSAWLTYWYGSGYIEERCGGGGGEERWWFGKWRRMRRAQPACNVRLDADGGTRGLVLVEASYACRCYWMW